MADGLDKLGWLSAAELKIKTETNGPHFEDAIFQ